MIVLQDVAWTDLHALVEFIYHGEVNVHQRSLTSFLKTAEVLRVSGLTQQHADDREQVKSTEANVPPTKKKQQLTHRFEDGARGVLSVASGLLRERAPVEKRKCTEQVLAT